MFRYFFVFSIIVVIVMNQMSDGSKTIADITLIMDIYQSRTDKTKQLTHVRSTRSGGIDDANKITVAFCQDTRYFITL